MNETDVDQHIATYEAPLAGDLIEELVDFWQEIFETPYDGFRDVLTGSEIGQNRAIIYVKRVGTKLAGTCHLTICQSTPELAGFGEVGTASEFRRMGIASTLCERARDDFREGGGQALFLGTGNPDAARVYTRLGWRKLVGANVMGCIADGRSPETFLVDYFRGNSSPVTITAGSASDRIPVIPLLICPHDWQVMDANAGVYSTRYVNQNSCMGLYPRYQRVGSGGRGTWFAGRTNQGCVVGLSTSRLDDAGGCQVDGFNHHDHPAAFGGLLGAAVSWASANEVTRCWARVSVEDEDKISQFEKLGFRWAGGGEPFDIGGRQVTSVRLERNT